MKPRIAIAGGGPGGLTLARILHRHGWQATVFEREADPLARPQGGTLDIHEESGQHALALAGLTDEFLRIARYEDQGSKLLDMHGRVLYEEADAAGGNRPEVDRTALRAMLLASLPDNCVRWNSDVREVRQNADGGWQLLLADGFAGNFDLVVGADGAWSRLRPLLSPYLPQYSGLAFIEFGIDEVDDRHPALSLLVGRGKLDAEGEGKGLIVQRNGNAHLRGYAVFRVPMAWVERRFDVADPVAARAELLRQFAGFAPELLDLIRASNDAIAPRYIHALPVGHRWPHRRGITLLGDAAHLMSPFGGEGVNAAMLDAAELAMQLVSGGDWDAAVAAYEAHMFERVIEAAEGSAEAAATQLSHDGLALSLEHWRSHAARPQAA
ncbi:FAD-dependent monooxygenase [Dyella sp. LX-66]|uniref:FAD-dependent oxidoreductase n=1 Tax=unclassified Dyella TaxID=2634549 RepID=UPI001BE07996|nr:MULTISPECIES: NAD(P)/FAD-dependent oxidoreductase [unclassified Dyella]MBT2119634.1 FAD-dependent monooxygenase [Dyella sp. LX-1]MBT2141329.1 FAD-dependent monooxygenase [Dyella sp. LX-66]MBT2142061.1 FAD-dependent monooxygenase [Dyella sp. LX-66]